MKCKYCDGTGEHINDANRMTTCEFCGGTGEVEVIGGSVTDVYDKCGGTGFFCEMRTGDFCALGSPCPHQKPMTNEEYIRSCSTEELAKLIIAASAMKCGSMSRMDGTIQLTFIARKYGNIQFMKGCHLIFAL